MFVTPWLLQQNTWQEPLKEGRVYFGYILKVLSIMVGISWWQECEEAGHVASTERRQREMNAGGPINFSFLFSQKLQLMELFVHS